MADDKGDGGGPHQRQHQRFSVDWRVTLKCPDWRFAAKVAAQNASRGGLFILTPRPPAIGSDVELAIELPDGTSLAVRGTVQHIITPEQAARDGRGPGIGVRIDGEHATDLILLEAMASHASDRDAPGTQSYDVDMDMDREDSGLTPLPVAPPPAPPLAATAPPASASSSGSMTAALGKIAIKSAATSIARAVGIDFGTTYSSVAVMVGDKVQVLADEMGRTLQPSIVSYPERGAPLVGWSARTRLAQEPRRTVASSKRLLGKSFSDPHVAGYMHSASYRTVAGPNDSILVDLDGQQLAVPQVCGAVIGHIRDVAERALKRQVREVVMSVPVTFTEQEKGALRRAVQIAGLEVIGLIEEPVAGALAYGLGGGVNEIVAVYDFGGGTFDFTVMDMSGGSFRVLATDGDAWLGGDDFDMAIAQSIADSVWRSTKVELRKRVVEWQRLVMACEEAKRQLSQQDSARVIVDGLIETPKRLDLKQKVDRATFERLTHELFERSVAVCAGALNRAGLEPHDVTQVIVTGGVSRIPYIRKELGKYFEREITPVVSPEEAIVTGAAIRARKLGGQDVIRPAS